MFRHLTVLGISLVALTGVAACTTIIEGQTQDVTIETLGTESARCVIANEQFRYTVNPPRTFKLQRTQDAYKVECEAPGNRMITAMLEPGMSDVYWMNGSNLFLPGLAVDATSQSMYKFPSKVMVDFRNIRPQREPLPEYQRLIAQDPHLHDVEEFRPSVPYMQRDIGSSSVPLSKTQRALDAQAAMEAGVGVDGAPVDGGMMGADDAIAPLPMDSIPSQGTVSPVFKSQPGDSADTLTRRANPGVFSGAGAYSMTPSAVDTRVPAPADAKGKFVGGTATIGSEPTGKPTELTIPYQSPQGGSQ